MPSPRSRSGPRSLRPMVGILILLLAGAASAVYAEPRTQSVEPQAPNFRPERAGPPPRRGADGLDLGVGVLIAPEIERWPSQYRPDGYRLEDYDGRDVPVRVCASQRGRIWSTADRECPQEVPAAEPSFRRSTR